MHVSARLNEKEAIYLHLRFTNFLHDFQLALLLRKIDIYKVAVRQRICKLDIANEEAPILVWNNVRESVNR